MGVNAYGGGYGFSLMCWRVVIPRVGSGLTSGQPSYRNQGAEMSRFTHLLKVGQAAAVVLVLALPLSAVAAAEDPPSGVTSDQGVERRGNCGYPMRVDWQVTATARTSVVDGDRLAAGHLVFHQKTTNVEDGRSFTVQGEGNFDGVPVTRTGVGAYAVDAWLSGTFSVRDSRGRFVSDGLGQFHYAFALNHGRIDGRNFDGPHQDEDWTGCALAGGLIGTGSAKRLSVRPVGTTRSPLGYLEYLPHSYKSTGPGASPLLLFLHGYGESGGGSEEEVPLLTGTGLPQLIGWNGWPTSRPFVVLAPQNPWETDDTIYADCLAVEQKFLGSCLMGAQHDNDHPVDGAYCFTPDEVHEFVQFALNRYNVDAGRVYVTGLSCGGFAAWEYASEHSDEVTAIAPIAGDGRPAWNSAGCTMTRVPVWAFHGLVDDTVDPEGSITPVKHLRACRGARAGAQKLTLYPDADHDSWTRTYDLTAGHDIYSWFLGFRRR